MIRPALETIFGAAFIALAPFLYLVGLNGLVLFGLPHIYGVPREVQQALAILLLLLGAWLAAGLCGAYPTWRKSFVALTGVLLTFLMTAAVYGTRMV